MKLKMTLLAGLVVSQFAVADDHFRQHDAHVHGHVEFNIAQDGQDLLVEITAPGADVVGFEHAPKTDAEKAAMADAKAKLNDVDSILTIPATASCKLVEAHVENTLEKGEHHDEHDHHDDHKGHDHHDDHKGHDHDHEGHEHHDDHKGHDDHEHHDEHKGHDHDHDHDHDHHDGHGEFSVQYQFSCEDVAKVTQIDTQWFTHFPSTEKVSVNLLTDSAQSATELTSGNTTIKF
ncbi:zinc uptake protein ZrgA [Vibrio maritimus]|uniref:zinc uptake protein ZrgA n=1 Tax=Vibrio maritimus TaxID=990268 RepID=UPI004068A228